MGFYSTASAAEVAAAREAGIKSFETSEVDSAFKSRHPGQMHACGHDNNSCTPSMSSTCSTSATHKNIFLNLYKNYSVTGNRTPVPSVTDWDTNHYTITD